MRYVLIIQVINFVLLLGVIGAITIIVVLLIKLLVKKNKLADIELQQYEHKGIKNDLGGI